MFKTILVPLDGSELAERAIPTAVAIARSSRQARIILLRVPDLRQMPPQVTGPMAVAQLLIDHIRESCQQYLDQLQGQLPSDIQSQVVLGSGDVASGIVETAVSTQTNLIIMTTHGRSGLMRWVLGSITEKVLQQAPCPVMALRTPTPPQNLLITLDGSQIAAQSLPVGLEIGRCLQANVTLLRVVEPVANFVQEEMPADEAQWLAHLPGLLHNRASNYLSDMVNQHESSETAGLQFKIVAGEAAPAILDYAEAEGIDLIVMTTHGHTGSNRWKYGSVTEKVLRSTSCAMLIMRTPASQLSG